MSVLAKEYTDLDHALDEVRSVLDEWSSTQEETSILSDETVHYTQLVLHEWIANLLQHAEFGDRSPKVQIELETKNHHVSCRVTDNSEGFNLAEQLPEEEEEDLMDDLPERGMGLRIINACTDHLSYTSIESGRHRFEFSIPADHDPWLSMLF